MNESDRIWGSPWRKLQQRLASQSGSLRLYELCKRESCDDGAAKASSWIKRAHERQLQADPLRQ